MATIEWEEIENSLIPEGRLVCTCHRAKVWGGWLVKVEGDNFSTGVTFVPDPTYGWK